MAAFTVAGLSFVGMPLLAGFITKWYLSLGALAAGAGGYVAVMALSSLLNASYWFPIVHRAFFRPAPNGGGSVQETNWLLLGPILVCVAYVVLLGVGADAPLMPFSVAESAVLFTFGTEPVP